jgi:hypothetical protein
MRSPFLDKKEESRQVFFLNTVDMYACLSTDEGHFNILTQVKDWMCIFYEYFQRVPLFHVLSTMKGIITDTNQSTDNSEKCRKNRDMLQVLLTEYK